MTTRLFEGMNGGPYSIGELIALIQAEFPELTVSKVRFLEGQGLISPRRSPAGYRMFSDDDVARVQYVLREQRDHFLPLKVIKSKLTAWERGDEPSDQPDTGLPPEAYFRISGTLLTDEELARASGLSLRQIHDLVSENVFEPHLLANRTVVFDEEDVATARAAHRLLAQGFEARHLRTMRLGAEREVDLLRQLVSPMLRHRNPDNRHKAAEMLADCAQAGATLQESMVKSRLRKLLDG
ncbi:MAG: MerR family transcriptional regulator [Actinomycetota bacterium]|nr:MerR family transcriptional regulator [Actinomycetota bacterium]